MREDIASLFQTPLFQTVDTRIREYRRDFHRYAEPGWGEYRTASLIAQRLEELGYAVKLGEEVIAGDARMGLPSEEVMQRQFERAMSQGAIKEYAERMALGYTGVVAELEGGNGPTIAFRFDIDAVELGEECTPGHFPCKEGFVSENEDAMHACGHDGHMSIGLGLAEVLAEVKDTVQGKVKLIFQPAEEGVRGAKSMVEAGVLDNVDYLIGFHIGLKAKRSGEFYCGTTGFLATSKFDATFKGTPAHAGLAPQEGDNALLSAATASLNLHAMPRHGGGATRINVGKLTAGSGRNVVPADAHLILETRGGDSALNSYMKEYARRVLNTSAEMHNTECEITAMGDAESGESDETLMTALLESARAYDFFPELKDSMAFLGGSEDFTHMMKRVKDNGGKASYCMLGSDLAGNHHTKSFDFDESVLIQGVKFLAVTALELKDALE